MTEVRRAVKRLPDLIRLCPQVRIQLDWFGAQVDRIPIEIHEPDANVWREKQTWGM